MTMYTIYSVIKPCHVTQVTFNHRFVCLLNDIPYAFLRATLMLEAYKATALLCMCLASYNLE